MKNLHKSLGTGAPAALSTGHRHYLRHYHFHRLLVIFFRIFLLTGFLFLWEFCASHQIIDSFIFSSPSKIMNVLLLMISDHSIFLHLGVTLYETFVSFFLVIFVSILFAILLWCFKGLSDCLEPFMVILNSLPKSALAPMLIVWLGTNTKAIIITAVSVAIFGMIINLYTGFLGIDKEKITLIRTLGGNKWHILCKLIIPGSKKIIIINMKVNIGLCLVGVIIGEFLAAKKGLGYLIIYGSQVFKMSYVVLGIVILCIISTLLFAFINIIQKLFLKD